MKYEKIIKRASGDKIKILVSFFIANSLIDATPTYNASVFICPRGKRKWAGIFSNDDIYYRRLSMEDRRKYIEQKSLEYITPEEMQAAKLELWEKLKPE